MDKLTKLEIEEIELMDIEDEESKQKFTIENRDQLSWAMRKIKAIDEEQSEIAAAAEVELNRIKTWFDSESKKLERDREFFESLIMIYAMKKKNENDKFKTETTPYGRVTFTKQQSKWNYNDEQLLPWLMESDHIDLIKIERKPKKDDIKKRFIVEGHQVIDTTTGETVPGIEVLEQGEKINIKINRE